MKRSPITSSLYYYNKSKKNNSTKENFSSQEQKSKDLVYEADHKNFFLRYLAARNQKLQ